MFVIYSRVTHNAIAYFLTVEGAENYMNLIGKTEVYMKISERWTKLAKEFIAGTDAAILSE